MHNHFSVHYNYDHEAAVVDAVGRLVRGESDCELRALISSLMRAGYRRFVFNLAHTAYIDTSVLDALVAAQSDARSSGGELKLASIRPHVGDLPQLSQMYVAFAIYQEEADALASFDTKPTPPDPPTKAHRIPRAA